MTKEELKKSTERVQWEYQYMPTNSNKIHRMDYPEEHYRTFLGDSAVKTDTIGSENDRVLKMFCYDAD